MTGDGVNDAPSLKKADTGIAVEGASDAARSAADIVFLAPGLSAIIDVGTITLCQKLKLMKTGSEDVEANFPRPFFLGNC